MAGLSHRQTEILNIARAFGRVMVEDLAKRFEVSAQTIRKDLILLERQGLLRRVHGGAVPADALTLIEAGLPAGVFQVVHGDKEAVDALLTHPDVKALGFVGSSDIAQYIYATAAANGKRSQCFGGAKNHMLVLPDADLDLVADSAVNAGFGSAGERRTSKRSCTADETLLTFWPPGPLARTKRSTISSSGTS